MATMNISLPDQMKQWVESRMDTGRYANTSDYIRALVRLDQENQEKRTRLIALLEKAEKEIEDGKFIDLNSDEEIDALFRDVGTKAKTRHEKIAAE